MIKVSGQSHTSHFLVGLQAYLIQAQVSMPLGNGLSEAVRQGVQHAVMRVHRWEPVLLQLVCHDADQLLHPLVVVSPVTNNLKPRTPHPEHKFKQLKAGFPLKVPSVLPSTETLTPRQCLPSSHLQTVGQVAIGVREVRLQLQGCAIRSNGLWYVPRILHKDRLFSKNHLHAP